MGLIDRVGRFLTLPLMHGMKKLGASTAEDLLEIFVRRHEAGSTLITTNRPTQDWGAFLGGVPAATAILDRFSRGRNHCANGRQELSLADPRHCGAHATRAVDAAGAMDAENAPTALSSGDDFKNGQKTPCMRTARTYAILTAPATGWFSNVR
jgi:hypothetical protein